MAKSVTEMEPPSAPSVAHLQQIRITFPDVMADWPWRRRISPYFEEVRAESMAWFRTFNTFGPKAQRIFEECNFCE
jgi:hypothetical protein